MTKDFLTRVVLAIALVVTGLVGVFMFTPPTASAATPPAPPIYSYMLQQVGSGLCAAIDYAAAGSSHPALLASCTTPGVDRVYYDYPNTTKTGTVNLALANNVCLDLYNKNKNNGAPLIGWNCATSDTAQSFTLTANGDGSYGIRTNVGNTPERCLDTANAGTTVYTPIVHGDCNGTSTQRWTKIGTRTPQLSQLGPACCGEGQSLCARLTTVSSGDPLRLEVCGGASDRDFYVLPLEGSPGYVRFLMPNHLCLAVKNKSTVAGSAVTATLCSGADLSQVWGLDSSDGHVTHVRYNNSNGLCLSFSGTYDPGAPVIVNACDTYNAAELWTVLAPHLLLLANTWLCAAIPGSAGGAAAVLATCSSTPEQSFYTRSLYEPTDARAVAFELGSQVCLEYNVPGYVLEGVACNSYKGFVRWNVRPISGTQNVRLTPNDAWCLDVFGPTVGIGANLATKDCSTSPTQQWVLM